jgi:hypothetical protein
LPQAVKRPEWGSKWEPTIYENVRRRGAESTATVPGCPDLFIVDTAGACVAGIFQTAKNRERVKRRI